MSECLQEQRLFDALLNARDVFERVARTNLTLVGIIVGSLLLKSDDTGFIGAVGFSVAGVILGVFAFKYTQHIAQKYLTVRRCIGALDERTLRYLDHLALDGEYLLAVAHSTRSSVFAVFGAVYVVLATTWSPALTPNVELNLFRDMNDNLKVMSDFAIAVMPLWIGLLIPYYVAYKSLKRACSLQCVFAPLHEKLTTPTSRLAATGDPTV